MKIVVAPDSFKGSLSAVEAARAIAEGARRAFPDAEIVLVPLADGGEGTADALITATQGRTVPSTVTGPLGSPVDAAFGFLGQSSTAVVEMAAAAGLLLIPPSQRDPRRTSTYGVGELLQAAVHDGADNIIVGLGGSATNDGGAGAFQALGVRFLDNNGEILDMRHGPLSLLRLGHIDTDGLEFPKDRVPITIASDVKAPLLGPTGASHVFGPQKGATPSMVAELEAALGHYADTIERDLGVAVSDMPGAGAAGGLGAGLMAFLGAQMRSGIELVLEAVGFDQQMAGADLLITGEGRIDAQTLQGKTVLGVLEQARKRGVPVIAFGGSVDPAALELLSAAGLRSAFNITPADMPLEQAMAEAYELLARVVEEKLAVLLTSARNNSDQTSVSRLPF